MSIQKQLKKSRLTSLFNIHHKIKLQLDEVCKEASGGDLDLKGFMEVYNQLSEDCRFNTCGPYKSGIDRNFKEDELNEDFNAQSDYYEQEENQIW